jgi:ribosomal protein L34
MFFSTVIKSLLPTRLPILSQIVHRSDRFYIPDWNLPHSTCGPRSKNIYKPHVMKRIAAHGLTTRLQSRGGKQILWRKLLQGKKGYVTLVAAP